MRWRLTLCFASLTLLACSCGLFAPDCGTRLPIRNSRSVTITEGAWGDVWFWQGDFMPGCPTGTVKPVVRQVLFYELTGLDSAVTASPGGPFYTRVMSKLVATTQSNGRGFFQVHLDPGTYSVFVREDTLLYSNSFDAEGHIFPVVVRNGEATGIRFNITYASAE